jgi:hypothetical protein
MAASIGLSLVTQYDQRVGNSISLPNSISQGNAVEKDNSKAQRISYLSQSQLANADHTWWKASLVLASIANHRQQQRLDQPKTDVVHNRDTLENETKESKWNHHDVPRVMLRVPNGMDSTSLVMDWAYAIALHSRSGPCFRCQQNDAGGKSCSCSCNRVIIFRRKSCNITVPNNFECDGHGTSDADSHVSNGPTHIDPFPSCVVRLDRSLACSGYDPNVLRRIRVCHVATLRDVLMYLLNVPALPIPDQPWGGIALDGFYDESAELWKRLSQTGKKQTIRFPPPYWMTSRHFSYQFCIVLAIVALVSDTVNCLHSKYGDLCLPGILLTTTTTSDDQYFYSIIRNFLPSVVELTLSSKFYELRSESISQHGVHSCDCLFPKIYRNAIERYHALKANQGHELDAKWTIKVTEIGDRVEVEHDPLECLMTNESNYFNVSNEDHKRHDQLVGKVYGWCLCRRMLGE